MLQHTQAMPTFCFRIVRAAHIVHMPLAGDPDGTTAARGARRSYPTVEHLNLAKTWADHASRLARSAGRPVRIHQFDV